MYDVLNRVCCVNLNKGIVGFQIAKEGIVFVKNAIGYSKKLSRNCYSSIETNLKLSNLYKMMQW